MAEYAQGAEARGLEVIIAGAGGAAHLPGMVAAQTVAAGARRAGAEQGAQRPGLAALDRADARRRAGGTLAIGKAGATNAGLLAVASWRPRGPSCARSSARSARSRPRRCAPRTACREPRRSCPARTLGVLGSGQLGRMFAIAARRMGYRVHTLSPDDDTPTGQVADLEITAAYDDLDAVREFARGVDVVTFEFENVSAAAAEAAAELAPVRPERRGAAHHPAPRCARRRSSPTTAFRSRRSRAVQTLAELAAALGQRRHARPC